MHAIEILLARPEIERLGWVLLHFVWQGAMIAALCAIAFVASRRASANLRYLIVCGALLTMAACLPVTWFLVGHSAVAGTGGTIEVVESRGRVSPRLDLRVSERRDYVPDTVSEELAPRQSSSSLSPSSRPEPVEATGKVQPAVSREPVERSNGGEFASGTVCLDRISAALPWLVTAWLIGVFGLSIRLTIGWRAVHRLRRRASQPADGSWQAVLSRLCERLHIRSTVRLLESSLVDVPTMIGWLRPVVLWPPALLAGLSIEQFEALLAHELAHVRRHDYLVNLVQTAIETLLFYHPAVWWLSRRIRHERECCCDDLAVAACGNRLSCARALATLEELRPPARQLVLAADGGRLLTRIRRILGQPAPRRNANRHWLLGLTLSATVLVVGVAVGLVNLATGDEPAKKSAETPANNTASQANPSKSPDGSQTTSGVVSVLDVEASGVWDVRYLDEELAERIQAFPHVKLVLSGGMSAAFALRLEKIEPVFIFGTPPGYSPLDCELKSGRWFTSEDHRKAIISTSIAEALHKSVGETISIHGPASEIVGIVEFKGLYGNEIVQMPLSDVQNLIYAPNQVGSFLVGVDVPNDEMPEHKAQLAELSDRIRALDEAIKVFPWRKGQPIPRAFSDAKLAFGKPKPEVRKPSRPGESRRIDVYGRVLDDATGKRISDYVVQSGTASSTQGREVINWGPTGFRPRADENGRLFVSLDWYAGKRARIVATGYVPQSVPTQPPPADGGMILEHVVRLQRGRQVSGRVVDFEGKPVASASVFVVGALADVNIAGGKASTRGGRVGWAEDPSISPSKTDAQGRFTVTGLGGDARYLAVSCSAFDHLVVPAPTVSGSQGDFVIHLPQPGKLIVHFDIPGGGDEAQVLLRPARPEVGTAARESEAGVVYYCSGTVKQHGDLVFDNLPPGDYVVERIKDSESVYGVVTAAALDRNIMKIASGQSAEVDFVRTKGASVSGQIVGVDRPEMRKATPARVFVTVEKASETRNNTPHPLLDAIDVGTIFHHGDAPEGKFTTERLPPGQYRIKANLFDDSRSDLTTLDKPSLFAGETLVTVTDDSQPPPVKIELQKIEQPEKGDSSPAKRAVDPPSPKESIEKPKPSPDASAAEQPKPGTATDKSAAGESGIELGIQNFPSTSQEKFELPDGIGDQIGKFPHVTEVTGFLSDHPPGPPGTGPAHRPTASATVTVPTVPIYGLAPDSPVVHKLKLVEGRRMTPDDHQVAMSGTSLGWKVGEKINIYGKRVEVMGVIDKGGPWDRSVIVPLSELQDWTDRPHRVTGYLIHADIPQDGSPEHAAELRTLRKQIAGLGKDVVSYSWVGNSMPPRRGRDLDEPDPVQRLDQSGENTRNVLAGAKGVVDKVHVEHGQMVEKGQLLLTLVDPDLTARIEDVQGKVNGAYTEWHAAERQLQIAARNNLTPEEKERLIGQASAYEKRVENLEKQLKILSQKQKELQVYSPVNGKIIIWQISEKLPHRPVDAGQLLLAIAVTDTPREKATEGKVPAEVTITVDPALAAELRALDGMRAGLTTKFENVDEMGRRLLDRYHKPEEQGQIYYMLLQVHGQSGLQTPEHIIDYAQKALKFPLGSRQELMVYVYWGDVLNVRKTEQPWPKQRSEAAAVYLQGLKRVWQYHAPESPPELPDPPPIDDSPDGPEHEAHRREMERYMALRNEADFIKELIYDRKIFICQIADMYHRRPAPPAEIDALRQQAHEIVGDDAAVGQLMAAVRQGNVNETAIDPSQANDSSAKPEKAIESTQPSQSGSAEKPSTTLAPATVDGGDDEIPVVNGRLELSSSTERNPAPSTAIKVSGRVVDDATGKPIPHFYVQTGHLGQGPEAAKQIVWPNGFAIEAGDAEGRFTTAINWDAGERVRVLARSFNSGLVLREAPKSGTPKIEGVVVPLQRGRKVSGRVLDKLGKPVAGASLFVVGHIPPAICVTSGKAMGFDEEASRRDPMQILHLVEDRTVPRFVSDRDGRFTVDGVSDVERWIAVSCPALDLQVVPAPPENPSPSDFEIRLRQAGKLIVRYDIPGAPEEAQLLMQPGTPRDTPPGSQDFVNTPIWLYVHPVIKQKGELVFDNLPPGEYDLVRRKPTNVLGVPSMPLDLRFVSIVSGETKTIEFVRDKGAPVTGRVVGLDGEAMAKLKTAAVMITVRKPGEFAYARIFDEVVVPISLPSHAPLDLKFSTERLLPGQYRIEAQLWAKPNRMNVELAPTLQGQTLVSVPESGPAEPIRIELAKPGRRSIQPALDEVTENPWSKPAGGLQARLMFGQGKPTNGTPIIATYLELRNVSDSATPLEVALDPSKIEFKVTDAGGKDVAQAGLPYDGVTAAPGTLRLPHGSEMRLSVAGNGAGVPKDQGGLLDVASSANWVFKQGDVGQYYLRAKIAIPKTDGTLWNGTIEIPDTRIPLPGSRSGN